MQTKRSRRFIVREKTFGLVVCFMVGGAQSAAIKACAKALDVDPEAPDDEAFAWACCSCGWAYVWMESYPEGNNFGALVHELYHVVSHFLRHIESQDEETGAYLLQYLYKEARKRLDKK